MLSEFLDHIFECAHCGRSAVYDRRAFVKEAARCKSKSCAKPLVLPPRLRVEDRIIVLGPGKQLFVHHIAKSNQLDFTSPVAEIVEHPQKPGTFGLMNLTKSEWSKRVGKKVKSVRENRAAEFDFDMKIDFGDVVGEIKLAGSLDGDESAW